MPRYTARLTARRTGTVWYLSDRITTRTRGDRYFTVSPDRAFRRASVEAAQRYATRWAGRDNYDIEVVAV